MIQIYHCWRAGFSDWAFNIDCLRSDKIQAQPATQAWLSILAILSCFVEYMYSFNRINVIISIIRLINPFWLSHLFGSKGSIKYFEFRYKNYFEHLWVVKIVQVDLIIVWNIWKLHFLFTHFEPLKSILFSFVIRVAFKWWHNGKRILQYAVV